MIDEQKATINSYDLVKLATSDRIAFKTSELMQMPSCIYNENKGDFDISLFNDSNFISFDEPKKEIKTKKEIKKTYFMQIQKQIQQEDIIKLFVFHTKKDITVILNLFMEITVLKNF